MRLYLKNARLIDGTGRPVQEPAVLVVENDTIVHAGPLSASDAPGKSATTTDLGGRTVIPGLVEAHLHLSYNHVKVIADLDLNCPPEYSTLLSARNAELVLHCGYTAARSAGSVHAIDVALKRARTVSMPRTSRCSSTSSASRRWRPFGRPPAGAPS